MKQPKTVRRIDEFAIGTVVSVDGVPSMSNLRLDNITDSGAHVIKDGGHITISRASPCFIDVSTPDEPAIVEKKTVEQVIEVVTPKIDEVPKSTGKAGRPQGVQGKIVADKLAALVFPTTPFTMKQIVELTGLDQIYIFPFVNKNCTVVGEADKPKGQRGRAAKLYLKK